MAYTILDVQWRTGGTGTVGIVAIATYADTWKAVIGVAPGQSEHEDSHFIAGFGAALSRDEAHAFFPHYDSTKYKEERQ